MEVYTFNYGPFVYWTACPDIDLDEVSQLFVPPYAKLVHKFGTESSYRSSTLGRIGWPTIFVSLSDAVSSLEE
jgi:uncharacterized protein YllA (UPF0747 family)